jgi:20S proteasome alpha/beta subunit
MMMNMLHLEFVVVLGIIFLISSHATERSVSISANYAWNNVECPQRFTNPDECIDFLQNPFRISQSIQQSRLFKPLDELQYHGTTTLSFICKDGIVVAVDSRASVGSYVGSRTVKKIFPLSKYIVATMAGGAADCAFWIRRTARQAQVLEHEYGSALRVGAIAKLLASSLREHRHSGLSVGTMVAGWDVETKTPSST